MGRRTACTRGKWNGFLLENFRFNWEQLLMKITYMAGKDQRCMKRNQICVQTQNTVEMEGVAKG